MAEYASAAEAFKAGYEATGSVLRDVESRDILKQAYAGTEDTKNEDTGKAGKDMFKVNSLAAQMAAQRGDTLMAEKFEKRAQETKTSAYENEIKENTIKQGRLENLEQTIHGLNTAGEAIDAIKASKLPENQKLAYINKLMQMTDKPGEFDKFKDNMQEAVLSAKDRLTAQQKTLKMQLDAELKQEKLANETEKLRMLSQYQQGMIDNKQFMAYLAQEKLISGIDKEISDKRSEARQLELKREKGGLTDEEKLSQQKDEANIKEEIRQLENRKKRIESGDRSSPNKAKEQKTVQASSQADIDKLKPGTKFIWTDGKTYIKE